MKTIDASVVPNVYTKWIRRTDHGFMKNLLTVGFFNREEVEEKVKNPQRTLNDLF